MNLLTPWEGIVVGIMFVLQFAFQIAAVVVGLVIWDRYLRPGRGSRQELG